MSLYTNIKFSNNLIGNQKCTITYSGYLFENNSQSARIVYGYGNDWKHTTEQLMEKTTDGFVAEVNVLDYDTFNFCFRNESYEWDNNNCQNYTSPISKEVQKEEIEENFIINENVLPDILDNLCSIDLSTSTPEDLKIITEEKVFEKANEISENTEANITTQQEQEPEDLSFEIFVEKIEPVNIEESLVNTSSVEVLDQDIETLFNEIYNTTTAETTTLQEYEQENSASISEIEIDSPVIEFVEKETVENIVVSNETTSEITTISTEVGVEIPETVAVVTEITENSEVVTATSETVVENILETVTEATEFDDIVTNNFDMNNLIDEILSPIVKSSVFEEESLSSLTNYTSDSDTVNFFDSFEESEDDIAVDNKIDNLIADLFNNTKEYSKQVSQEEQNTQLEETESNTTNSIIENTEINTEYAEENLQETELPKEQSIEEPTIISYTTNENFDETVESEDVEEIEESLIDSINETTALVEVSNENDFIVSPRSLGKFYMLKKKIKLAFAKLFSFTKIFGRGFNNSTN